ncbi:MAG: copper resistance protein CopC [Actinomycetes bacterium]
MTRRSTVLLLLAALALVPLAPAAAHTSLRTAAPADGDRLPAAPARLTLTFTDEVLALGAEVAVSGPTGPVDVAAPEVSGTDVVAALPADLPRGDYRAAWRVTARDGHPISGELAFTVAGTTRTASAVRTTDPAPAAEPPPDAAPVSRWWWVVGAAALVGAATAAWASRRRGRL